MNQEILFSRSLSFASPSPGAQSELFFLTAYQDSRLTFVADAVPLPAPDAPFNIDEFRSNGFSGEHLRERIEDATLLLPGGMRICGFMLSTRYASDLALLEAKVSGVGAWLAEAEEVTEPELILVSCAEGRSRISLYNTSSGFIASMKHAKVADFAKRVGRLRLALNGFYAASEPSDSFAFGAAVVAAAREELLRSDFLADGRVVSVGQRLGEVRSGEVAQLKSSDAAVARLLSAGGAGKERGGLQCSMTLFCYYSLVDSVEEVVARLCEDFERSLRARAALSRDNAFLAKRFLAERDGLFHCFYAGDAEKAEEGARAVRERLGGAGRVEVSDCEPIEQFQWRSLGLRRAVSAQTVDFSRTVPQILTVCLAILLALLLKKVLIG